MRNATHHRNANFLPPSMHLTSGWRYLLEGSEITIGTDHELPKVFRTKRPMMQCLARFMDEVEHYDPTIVYRPGKLQAVPDALSGMAGQSEGEPANIDPLWQPGCWRRISYLPRIMPAQLKSSRLRVKHAP